jgi:hypothetical protein
MLMVSRKAGRKPDSWKALCLAILLGAYFCLGRMDQAAAQVQVNINVAPPPYAFPAPPPVAVVPGTYVYVVPGIAVDILFYHGYWYRPHKGYWYRAPSYNGPWVYLSPPKIPRALIELPPYYRSVPPGHQHIPYGQLKKNWKQWEQRRYWENNKEWHQGWHGGPEGKGEKGRGKAHEKHDRHGEREGGRD